MNKFRDIMPQARYARKGELHTYERSVFPQSHYVAKYMLTCLSYFLHVPNSTLLD